ncbi:putative Ig domain-containing protein [Shewanella waksmanii]|uniref:putative Ig domain-containing protein n=1 Tax=Shewanella waksmanii TaxID=213783 RepID=UPI00048CA17C|nr:putative Ig domain-containing protein [Shewanella waksmanii]
MIGLFDSVKCGQGSPRLVISSVLLFIATSTWANSDDISLSSAVTNSSVADGNISTVTYTVTTMNGQNATDIEFLANLPAGHLIAPEPFATTTCTDGSFTAAAGTSSFSASDYRLGSDSSCTFSFNVEVTQTGNIVSAAFNSSLGTSADTSETITVDTDSVKVSLSASPALISVGNISTLHFDFDNPSASMVFSFSAKVDLPSGLTIAPNPNFTQDCLSPFTLSEAAGASSISLSSGAVGASAACRLSIDVLADRAGDFDIQTGVISTFTPNKTIGKASANLVAKREFVNLVFEPLLVQPSGSADLNVTITNFNRSFAASDITFTNNLLVSDDPDAPATTVQLSASATPIADVCGAGSTLSGSQTITLLGAQLGVGESCTFTVPVSVPADAISGFYLNKVTGVSAMVDGQVEIFPDVTNGLSISNAPALTMQVLTAPFTAKDDVTLRYNLENIDAGNTASAISFATRLGGTEVINPAAVTLPGSGFCGAGSSASLFINSDIWYLNVSNASLAGGANCSFDLIVALADDVRSGEYSYSAETISATINADTVTSGNPSASVAFNVESAPRLSLSFVDDVVTPGAAAELKVRLYASDGSSADASNVGFTLDLNSGFSGLVATGLPSNDVCGSGSSISGVSTLSFSGGTVAPGEDCEFTVPLQLPADTVGSYTLTSSEVAATIAGSAVNSPLSSTSLTVSGLSFTKSFVTNPVRVGTAGTNVDLTYLITNAVGADDATSINFTESFSNTASGITIVSADQSAFCGAGSSAVAAGFLLAVNDVEVNNGSQCAFTVTLNIPNTVASGSYLSLSSSLTANVGGGPEVLSPAADFLQVDELSVATSIDVTSPTSASTINYVMSFSTDVANFDITDISVINGSLANFAGSGADYSVEVTPLADGDVTLSIAADVADDAVDATVKNIASQATVFEYQTAPLIPTPSLTLGDPSVILTNAGPVTFDISYLDVEQVNLTAADVTLNRTGDANADVSILNGDSTSAQVSLSNLRGEGSIGISIAEGTARFSTNQAPAAGPSNVFAVDTNAPSVTLSGPTGVQSDDFVVDIVFNENVLGFDQSDIAIVNGTIESFNAIDAQNYQITVSATGTLDVDLSVAASSAQDAAGNGHTVSNTLVISFDDEAPSVTISGPTGDVASSFTVTFAFSEDVTGFSKDDITVNNADLGTLASSDAKTYSIDVTPTVQATVTLDVAADVAVDGASNGNLAGAQYSVNYDINDAPVIAGTPDVSVFEDAGYNFTPTASDADTLDTLTFSIVNKPTWASFSNTDGTLSGTPTNNDVGTTSSIVITVSDGALSTDLAAFDIEVVNSNDAPLISGTPASTVDQGEAYSFTPTSSDDDVGDTLVFNVVNKPDWATFNSTDGTLSGMPTNANVGVTSGIIISVTDGTVTSALPGFNLAVVNVNDTPTISGTPATSVNQGVGYNFTPTATDIDSADVLSFSIVNKPVWATFSSVNGALSGTPTNDDVGMHSGIIISVSDGTISVPLPTFSINVINVNDAPVITGTPNTLVSEGNAYSFTPIAADADAGDSLSFSIVNAPSWAVFSSADGTLSGTPTAADIGVTAGVVITVTDGSLSASLPAFSITVAGVNEAPVISGVPSVTVNEGEPYLFAPIATDVDADSVLVFSINNQPSWATFDTNNGSLSGTPTSIDIGVTNNIVITVSDGELSASLPVFSIEVVSVNTAPQISGSPLTTVEQDKNYSFMPSATDEDGDTLSFSIINQPSWASFDTSSGALTGMPSSADIGTTSGIVIAVSDGVESTALTAFDIEVVNVNDAPEISGVPASSVLEGELYSFTPTVTDADENEQLTFSIVNKPLWAMFDSQVGTLSGTPSNSDVGQSSDIQITVTDKAGESDTLAPFNIEVINVNNAPIFTSSPVTEIVAEQAYQYQLTAEDVDIAHTLSFSLVSGPQWLAISNSGLVEGTAPAESIGESFAVVVGVTDGEIDSAVLQQYTLRVIAPGNTELTANLYFSPAPVAPEQAASLIVELNNTGLADAESVTANVTLSDDLVISTVPSQCSSEQQVISCQLTESIASSEQFTATIAVIAGGQSGFDSAELLASASNVEAAVSAQAQLLVAESLATIPGQLLSSSPVEIGYAVDINADGLTDLVSYNNVAGDIEIWLNNGLGQLLLDKSIAADSAISALLVADIDGDGHHDVITTGGLSGSNLLYLLDGSQALIGQEVVNAVDADIAVVTDLFGNGDKQLILAGIYQTEIAVYSGIGSGNTSVELVNFFELAQLSSEVSSQSSIQDSNQVTSSDDVGASITSDIESAADSHTESTEAVGISSIDVVEINGQAQLLLSSTSSEPVLAAAMVDGWQATMVNGLPQGIEKLMTADIDGNGAIDGFIYHDGAWSLVIDLLSDMPQVSTVNLPQANKILVADLQGDGTIELLFVTSQGVSIWHYYSVNDIRVSPSVIGGADIAEVLLVDVDSDGDLDVVTLDAQQGMSLWFLTSEADFGAQEVDVSLFAQAPNFPQTEKAGPVEFIVSNVSLGDASQVVLTVAADSGITLSQLPNGCSLADNGMVCNVGQLNATEQHAITVWITTANAGSYTLTGMIDSAEADTNSQNDSVTVNLVVPEQAKQSSSSGALAWYLVVLLSLLALYRSNLVRRAKIR